MGRHPPSLLVGPVARAPPGFEPALPAPGGRRVLSYGGRRAASLAMAPAAPNQPGAARVHRPGMPRTWSSHYPPCSVSSRMRFRLGFQTSTRTGEASPRNGCRSPDVPRPRRDAPRVAPRLGGAPQICACALCSRPCRSSSSPLVPREGHTRTARCSSASRSTPPSWLRRSSATWRGRPRQRRNASSPGSRPRRAGVWAAETGVPGARSRDPTRAEGARRLRFELAVAQTGLRR